jgi:hypothetical protein
MGHLQGAGRLCDVSWWWLLPCRQRIIVPAEAPVGQARPLQIDRFIDDRILSIDRFPVNMLE